MEQDRKPSLHVAITSTSSELDVRSENRINKVFAELFSESYKLVSRSKESGIVELIYEVQTPIFNDKSIASDFYEGLEVMLDELKEFSPHFTQLRRVGD